MAMVIPQVDLFPYFGDLKYAFLLFKNNLNYFVHQTLNFQNRYRIDIIFQETWTFLIQKFFTMLIWYWKFSSNFTSKFVSKASIFLFMKTNRLENWTKVTWKYQCLSIQKFSKIQEKIFTFIIEKHIKIFSIWKIFLKETCKK